jgi:hypothetical protein
MYWNVASWICVVAAVGAAVAGAQWWGVAGVIYGVAVGWLGRIIVSLVLSIPHLRTSRQA